MLLLLSGAGVCVGAAVVVAASVGAAVALVVVCCCLVVDELLVDVAAEVSSLLVLDDFEVLGKDIKPVGLETLLISSS